MPKILIVYHCMPVVEDSLVEDADHKETFPYDLPTIEEDKFH